MMNKNLYRSIIGISMALTIAFYLIAYVITGNNSIALGFLIGSLARLIGFISIIFYSEYFNESMRPGAVAAVLYIVRFVFYGFVVAWSISKGVNVLSLLVGFIILNFVIIVTQWRMRRAA